MIRKCFTIIFAFMFVSCSHQFIEGEYYIDNSDTKIIFNNNFLTIQEGNEVTIESILEKKSDNNITYAISEIKLNDVMENHKKRGLELGKKIYINKPSISEDNKFLNDILQINGNFYGNTFTYNLNKDCLKIKSIESVGLFDIEVTNFEKRNTTSLIDSYDISLVGNYNRAIKQNIKYVFDKDSKTIALLPLDIVSNFGLEFSIKYRVDDNNNGDGGNEVTYEEDLEIEEEIIVRAIKFDISEEVFFYYYRPAKITLMFSPSKKECPGFKKYIYETETQINLENRYGKQIFYFIDDIPACQSIFIMIDEFYEGLTDKIVVSDIEFFIK